MSAQTKDGGPAFPAPDLGNVMYIDERKAERGMTLRDYLAAKAMQGLMAMCATGAQTLNGADNCARLAYEQADAMLKAREVRHD